MVVNKKHVLLVLTFMYIIWYLFKVVHRPKLFYYPNELNKKVVKQCKRLRDRYWPLFLFHNTYFQLFLSVFIGKIYPLIYKATYKREMFTYPDGQSIGLDWIFPVNFNQNLNNIRNVPIVIGLYGISGDNKSLNIYRLCRLINTQLNWCTVVLGRRGHETDIPLTVPKMSFFGLQNDIHEALLHIHKKYPHNPVMLLGDSAGTGFWCRYTGDLALCINQKSKNMHNKSSSKLIIKQYKNAQQIHDKIICGVLISPGYDIDTVFKKASWFNRQLILFLIKKTFIKNHKNVIQNYNKEICDKCDQSSSCLEFFREYSGTLSGYKSYNEFIIEANPTETGRYATIPSLVFNSRDDPICTKGSLDEWKWLYIKKNPCPNAILCETQYGSHCAFLSMFGGFYVDNVILDYMKTMWQMRIDEMQ